MQDLNYTALAQLLARYTMAENDAFKAHNDAAQDHWFSKLMGAKNAVEAIMGEWPDTCIMNDTDVDVYIGEYAARVYVPR